MGFQPSSELSSTDGWWAQVKRKSKTVPDSWSSNTEASSAELCRGSRDEHVTAIDWTEVCSTGGVDQRGADVFEVGWTGATDAVKCGSRNFELNPELQQLIETTADNVPDMIVHFQFVVNDEQNHSKAISINDILDSQSCRVTIYSADTQILIRKLADLHPAHLCDQKASLYCYQNISRPYNGVSVNAWHYS